MSRFKTKPLQKDKSEIIVGAIHELPLQKFKDEISFRLRVVACPDRQ
jgi:hypothetical protein